MSGPFYGSLAASASVFVAILTALLVNSYVTIKSDRRQVRNELNRIQEELEGLRDQRDNHQETIDALVEKRESDYREKAKKQVNEFIDSKIPSEYAIPIEKLNVEVLYRDLINFHGYESAEELEDSPINLHHRELLEEQIDDIEDQILHEVIPPFASKFEGKGWDPESDPEHESLLEKLAAREDIEEHDNDQESVESHSDGEDDEPDLVVEADLERDVLEQEEFIEKYKEEHGLDTLDDKTREALENQYNKVVDKNPYQDTSSPSGSLDNLLTPNPYNSIQPGFMDAMSTLAQSAALDDPMAGMDFEAFNSVLGLSVQEQQKLAKERDLLQETKNEIRILEQRQNRLEREKEGLHPEDLVPTLTANVATILLSVVIPIFAFLLLVTNTVVTVPAWASIISHTEVNVFFSWLLGLLVVFESIHARINDREPQAFNLYKRTMSRLSRD